MIKLYPGKILIIARDHNPSYGKLYCGSFEIDNNCNVAGFFEGSNARVEVQKVIIEEHKMIIYSLYQEEFSNEKGPIIYYSITVTSKQIYELFQKDIRLHPIDIQIEELIKEAIPK